MRLPAFIRRRHERGPTLSELMIVLSLMAAPTAIALPSDGKYHDRIRSAQAVADIGTTSTPIENEARASRGLPSTLAQVGLARLSNRASADDIIRGNKGKFVGRGADF